VRKGYAQAYPYPPNTAYETKFAAAQNGARTAGRGIWGLPKGQQCKLADRGNGPTQHEVVVSCTQIRSPRV
jgi:endonuclease YncB( thermonuclease family)